MSNEINYQNNPLHGVSLKQMLVELIGHYGFEILYAYLNINCFKTNPSVDASVKFLKKTDWAREKVEVFYLYEYKNLPRASSEQFALSPRDRVVPAHQSPGEPKVLTLEDAERLREKRALKAAESKHGKSFRSGSGKGYQGRNRTQRDGVGSSGKPSNRSGMRPDDARSTDNSASAASSAGMVSGGVVDPWAKARNK
jgi:uncharacterized protein (DUF2132 family)